MFKFVIPALAFHLAVIAPAFADLVPDNMPYDGTLHEFTLMDNVTSSRPIIDIKRVQNIMKRRDMSCDIIYTKVFGASVRKITVDEVYGATQHCKHEFYQGALKDWEHNDPLFGDKILPYFLQAMRADMASNSYFGDITRPSVPGGLWSTNVYDGIWKWIAKYRAMGVIPASQAITMPVTDMRANPATAFGIIQSLVDKQNVLLRSFPASEKMIIVTQALLDGYRKYLRSIAVDTEILYKFANGVEITSIDGIAIFVEPTWEPIMTELYGANNNAALLTLRGNFVFGTDTKYGEGPNGDRALMVWYEDKDLSWYYQLFLRAGTQISLPEHVVFAFPA